MGSVSGQPASRAGVSCVSAHVLALGVAIACAVLPAPAGAASRRTVAIKAEPAVQTPPGQRTILISLKKQRLRLFDNGREIASSRVSSGKPGFDTPAGVFSILEKNVYHESNIYEGAPMPFMQRITWSGIAMHAGVVPGYRASHGCIRLPYSFAQSFFSKTNVGGRVIITQDEVNPVSFQHATLFKPLPEHDPVPEQGASASEPRVAASDATEAGKAALSNIVGNAAAAATPAEIQAPEGGSAAGKARSRAEVTRRFAAKLESLQTAMKTAEEKKSAASEKAKAALRAAQDAETRLNEVRRPFEGVLRAAAQAEANRADAARAYRNALAQTGVKASEPPARKNRSNSRNRDRDREAREAAAVAPEDREQELEDRLLDASLEADAAKAAAAQGEAAIAEAKAAFAAADAEKQRAIEEVRTAVIDLRNAQTALVDAKSEATRRSRPLSIFISLKSQRLYIRQGFEPIFEGPIEVDDPPGAIGTHVLTVLDYDETGNNFKWHLVSAQPPRPASSASETASGKKKRERDDAIAVSANSPLNVEAVRVALDAIRIPPDVQEQISELARPGTSLIISEKDLSRETGKGTEFVILTR